MLAAAGSDSDEDDDEEPSADDDDEDGMGMPMGMDMGVWQGGAHGNGEDDDDGEDEAEFDSEELEERMAMRAARVAAAMPPPPPQRAPPPPPPALPPLLLAPSCPRCRARMLPLEALTSPPGAPRAPLAAGRLRAALAARGQPLPDRPAPPPPVPPAAPPAVAPEPVATPVPRVAGKRGRRGGAKAAAQAAARAAAKATAQAAAAAEEATAAAARAAAAAAAEAEAADVAALRPRLATAVGPRCAFLCLRCPTQLQVGALARRARLQVRLARPGHPAPLPPLSPLAYLCKLLVPCARAPGGAWGERMGEPRRAMWRRAVPQALRLEAQHAGAALRLLRRVRAALLGGEGTGDDSCSSEVRRQQPRALRERRDRDTCSALSHSCSTCGPHGLLLPLLRHPRV